VSKQSMIALFSCSVATELHQTGVSV